MYTKLKNNINMLNYILGSEEPYILSKTHQTDSSTINLKNPLFFAYSDLSSSLI